MTENEAIKDIKENVQPSVGGISLEMAIQALEEIQQYRAIGTVEELEAMKEVMTHLLTRHLHQTIELYAKEECADDLEPILLSLGISSNVLDEYKL